LLTGLSFGASSLDSSGVYICISIVKYVRHGNFICKSEGKWSIQPCSEILGNLGRKSWDKKLDFGIFFYLIGVMSLGAFAGWWEGRCRVSLRVEINPLADLVNPCYHNLQSKIELILIT
jgi:hypothetical protein